MQLANDPIGLQIPWLNTWFEMPKKELLALNSTEHTILNELSAQWSTSNKLGLLNALRQRFGPAAYDVVDQIVAVHIRQEWAEVARQRPTQTMDDLVQMLWEPLPAQGFEFTMEKKSVGIQIQCTRCPHAELGKELHGTDWLYHLVCSGDPHLVEGFNPQIGFRRTQTLMEGHLCCDHFYFLKSSVQSP